VALAAAPNNGTPLSTVKVATAATPIARQENEKEKEKQYAVFM
jgi:hypothetical protein